MIFDWMEETVGVAGRVCITRGGRSEEDAKDAAGKVGGIEKR